MNIRYLLYPKYHSFKQVADILQRENNYKSMVAEKRTDVATKDIWIIVHSTY